MNPIMEQLLTIFGAMIRENASVTFAYSRLEDRWYYLSLKYGDAYDFAEAIMSPQKACEKMLAECQYYWLKKHGLIFPDLSLQETVDSLPPDLRPLLADFLSPYQQAAQKALQDSRL